MLIVILFPGLLTHITRFLGIEVASNGLFVMCIFFIIILLVFLTSVVSELTGRINKLAQKDAIVEKRLRDLEKAKEDDQ